MHAATVYPEHDLFIQLMKLKNTLRHLQGEELITHLGLEYYSPQRRLQLGRRRSVHWRALVSSRRRMAECLLLSLGRGGWRSRDLAFASEPSVFFDGS
jgi:hypothetical protein